MIELVTSVVSYLLSGLRIHQAEKQGAKQRESNSAIWLNC
jgi:hypothetical protein